MISFNGDHQFFKFFDKAIGDIERERASTVGGGRGKMEGEIWGFLSPLKALYHCFFDSHIVECKDFVEEKQKAISMFCSCTIWVFLKVKKLKIKKKKKRKKEREGEF